MTKVKTSRVLMWRENVSVFYGGFWLAEAMNFRFQFGWRQVRWTAAALVMAAGLCALSSAPLRAEGVYLTPGHPDGVAWLAPPPARGSEEETAELAMVRMVCRARTPAETARAKKDSTLSLFNF